METATEVEVVFTGGTSNKTDLGDVGAGATVGTACHADGDRVVAESDTFDNLINFGDEFRQVAL